MFEPGTRHLYMQLGCTYRALRHTRRMRETTRGKQVSQSLCIWEPGVVRTPREASRLLEEGCETADALPSNLLQRFLEQVIVFGRGAFRQVSFQRGRIAIETCDHIAFWLARTSAFQLGLSTFDVAHGVQVSLRSPTALALSRVFSLLADQGGFHAYFSASRVRVHAFGVPGEGLRMMAETRSTDSKRQLGVLGFSPVAADEFKFPNIPTPNAAGRTVARLLVGDPNPGTDIHLSLTSRPQTRPPYVARPRPNILPAK